MLSLAMTAVLTRVAQVDVEARKNTSWGGGSRRPTAGSMLSWSDLCSRPRCNDMTPSIAGQKARSWHRWDLLWTTWPKDCGGSLTGCLAVDMVMPPHAQVSFKAMRVRCGVERRICRGPHVLCSSSVDCAIELEKTRFSGILSSI